MRNIHSFDDYTYNPETRPLEALTASQAMDLQFLGLKGRQVRRQILEALGVLGDFKGGCGVSFKAIYEAGGGGALASQARLTCKVYGISPKAPPEWFGAEFPTELPPGRWFFTEPRRL